MTVHHEDHAHVSGAGKTIHRVCMLAQPSVVLAVVQIGKRYHSVTSFVLLKVRQYDQNRAT